MRTALFCAGIGVGAGAAYYFAIRPLALAAELSAQAGLMLIQARARPSVSADQQDTK